MNTEINFKVYGRYALFTDPLTRMGGEKFSYHVPTYEALKGITKSIYWKPTFVWVIDKVRVMKYTKTESKNMKLLSYSSNTGLAIYTYLADVEYQVKAHFEWNLHRKDLIEDRDANKHWHIAQRMLEKGGRQDIFLGTRECQGYVEPCNFGNDISPYDNIEELAFGLMFHGYDYPDEIGKDMLQSRFFYPKLEKGIITFPHPEDCKIVNKVRDMIACPPSLLVEEITL